MLGKTFSGISAGILVSIGGTVFLSSDNRYIGAVLFSIALLCVCVKEYSLFTGKIGYIPEKHSREDISVLLWGLLGNIISTVGLGAVVRYALPAVGAAAEAVCALRLEQLWPQTLIRAIFCGMLMYLAVSIYREKNTVTGIFLCVPVFIISGFEHSIADLFYFSAAGMYTPRVLLFILVVIAGNAIGGMILPVFKMIEDRSVKK